MSEESFSFKVKVPGGGELEFTGQSPEQLETLANLTQSYSVCIQNQSRVLAMQAAHQLMGGGYGGHVPPTGYLQPAPAPLALPPAQGPPPSPPQQTSFPVTAYSVPVTPPPAPAPPPAPYSTPPPQQPAYLHPIAPLSPPPGENFLTKIWRDVIFNFRENPWGVSVGIIVNAALLACLSWVAVDLFLEFFSSESPAEISVPSSPAPVPPEQ